MSSASSSLFSIAMKDPSVSPSRRAAPELKLLVSFNGTFCRLPPFQKLRYTGGETRIISVDRGISFSKLKSKIVTDLVRPNAAVSGFRFSLKYHISQSFCGRVEKEGDGPIIVSLETDDDVRSMVDEYEAVELSGKFLKRLWLFVCDNSNDDSGFVSTKLGNLNIESDGFYEGEKGVAGIQGDQSLRLVEGFLSDGKATYHRSKKFNDDCLRKTVLRQQLLAKKFGAIKILRGLDEQSEIELTGENGDCEAPRTDLCSEPERPPSFHPKKIDGGRDLGRKVTDYKYVNSHRTAHEIFEKVFPVTQSNNLPLNSKDGNFNTELDNTGIGFSGLSRKIIGGESTHSLESPSESAAAGQPPKLSKSKGNGLEANYDLKRVCQASLSYKNRENIMPRYGESGDNIVKSNDYVTHSCQNQLTGTLKPSRSSQGSGRGKEGCQDDIRKNQNHKCSSRESRSQRTCQDSSKVGKLDPQSTIILKQEPVLRSYTDASRKPFTNSSYHKGKEVGQRRDCGPNDHNKMFNLPFDGQEEIPMKTDFCRDLKMADPGEGYIADARTVGTQIDLLTGPGSDGLHIACQALNVETLGEVGINGKTTLDSSQRVNLRNQQGDIGSCHLNNLSYNNGSELRNKCIYGVTETGLKSNINRAGVYPWDDLSTAAVNLSPHTLPLETSSKLQVLTPSCAKKDKSQILLMPQCNVLDVMDEEPLKSGPKVRIDVSSNSSSDNAAKVGKDNDEKQEIQQDFCANLSMQENERMTKGVKANGALAAVVYTHLATRELQNIKNSDLEFIKELGSGTFGTVYYGKWKGSDVAIKRIKSCCFTDSAKEADQLVADFWKEAHILGQLRHPNIVAMYGVASDGPLNSLAAVTEYMVNGSLKQVLRRKDGTIDRRKRLIIAMDATAGMEYLHEKNIVHFDLKSDNFLMNTRDPHRPVCKIGDLGLSKIKQRTLVSGGVRGTLPWMAPELLNGNDPVSEKVDVYSFAIVMWELLTGEEPYKQMRSEEIIGGIIRGDLRPEVPRWCEPAWRSLMERCWSSDPDSRPPFSEIAKEVRVMAASMNIK